MKFRKLSVCAFLAVALSIIPLAGCSDQATSEEAATEEASFSYSDGLDENGYWEGVTALDYVTLPDYQAIRIPDDASTVSDESLRSEIDSMLTSYATSTQITDRAIVDGDSVNIDYVGSIDGIEFEGGNTNGAGTDVIIGETSYIDDFLEQLIGHTPGETINIEVTFPDDYSTTDLAGKDAVFVTTLNHIVETSVPELTDEFVSENFSATNGWMTADEMRAGVSTNIKKKAIQDYIQEYLVNESTVSSTPEQIIDHQDRAMIRYYEEYAGYYGVTLDEFISSHMEMDSIDALKEANAEANEKSATYYLIIQAIAEDMGLVPHDEHVASYFSTHMGTDDYSQYEEQYGMPYLKQIALSQMVFDHLIENAKVA